MKAPKYIYTYWQTEEKSCRVIKHELRIYQPYCNRQKNTVALGDNLFDIVCQSNTDDHNIGLRRAYALHVERLSLEKPGVVPLVKKLAEAAVTKQNSFPPVIRALKKLGAVRFALGKVEDPKSYNGKEFMPRKYAGKKSAAYWTAINAGLDIE